ncbi:MAG: glycoside hydrolase family 127 protein [Acidobacteriota bacterium]|nr:glycoside hydrolase family 127 protein [Acidobacteriota bacterium]
MKRFLGFLAAAVVAAGAVPEKFAPAPYETQHMGGMLGERMRVNLEGRLLHVDEARLLRGFEQPPGEQAWIGEHAGKYLDAACNTWRFTHDPRLKQQMDRIARALMQSQRPDGYLGTYADDKRWTAWDVWVHKYDLIGLLNYHETTGDPRALQVARGIGDLLVRTFGTGPGQRDLIAASTHVGMAASSVLEPMVTLYRQTGDQRYLGFCWYIVHSWDQPNGPKILASLRGTGSVFQTANAKAYEMMSDLIGVVELYRVTGDESLLPPVLAAWHDIRDRRLYITGATSSKEHFQDDHVLPGGDKDDVGEGCATVTWLQLTWRLFKLTGETEYVGEMERTVYNQLLGAQDPHNGNICYFTPLNGAKKPTPGINCCVSSEPRGISLIPQIAWGSTERGPAMVLYTAGDFETPFARIVSSTTFPADGSVRLTIQQAKRRRFTLQLRVPRWTGAFTATVGKQVFRGEPGSWLAIERDWKAGDTVVIAIEMTVQVLPGGRSYPDSVAIQRGPEVLAAEDSLNPNGVTSPGAPPLALKTLPPPAGWSGTQVYSAGTLTLVPFADAIAMKVWLPAR